MPKISLYRNIKHTETTDTIELDDFLNAVAKGRWQDAVLKIRTIKDEEMRRAEKARLPNVTVSGIFGKRVDADCKQHSGFIAIDIDDLGTELEGTRTLLQGDAYVYAIFTSVSGRGLCVLIKIDPDRHRDAFEAIASHFVTDYQIVVDPTGINPSRVRYVSYDPELHVNPDALKFKKYLPKPKKRKVQSTIFVQTEFDSVIDQMVKARVSCVEDYRDWRDIGFGLSDQFGEGGRAYFHALSACSDKYEPQVTDTQYTKCLKANAGRSGKKITIATIYWHALKAGIQVASKQTNNIANQTSILKKAGLDAEAIKEKINIPGADDIIRQAFASPNGAEFGQSLVENVKLWLKCNYKIRRDLITRKIHVDGKIIDDIKLNTMFLDCKIQYDKLSFELFVRIMFSETIEDFNPLLEFFAAHAHLKPRGVIEKFFACFDTPDDLQYFGKKWLVGAISAAHGVHSPLMLVFAGELQGTGKTEAFRRLLPPELKMYYAESKLDAGKDDEILMTQKWFIMDDEMGGKSKQESKRLKELTSKEIFTLREPYGRVNVDLVRLAVLCGTTNDLEVLNDFSGNRRLLPHEIKGMDFAAYNAVNKTELLMEAYHLYKSGWTWELTREDVLRLEGRTEKFNENSVEYDMIQKHFKTEGEVAMTATDIKEYIEGQTNQRLSLKRVGMELKRLGHKQEYKRINFRPSRIYMVSVIQSVTFDLDIADLPF